eukprot:6906438-Heterocapsa_arctica.AAC.1
MVQGVGSAVGEKSKVVRSIAHGYVDAHSTKFNAHICLARGNVLPLAALHLGRQGCPHPVPH